MPNKSFTVLTPELLQKVAEIASEKAMEREREINEQKNALYQAFHTCMEMQTRGESWEDYLSEFYKKWKQENKGLYIPNDVFALPHEPRNATINIERLLERVDIDIDAQKVTVQCSPFLKQDDNSFEKWVMSLKRDAQKDSHL